MGPPEPFSAAGRARLCDPAGALCAGLAVWAGYRLARIPGRTDPACRRVLAARCAAMAAGPLACAAAVRACCGRRRAVGADLGGAAVSALPNEAIIDYQGKKYIFIKTEEGHEHEEENHAHESQESAEHKEEGQHFLMQEITVGNSELGYTEVTLSEGWNNENEVAIKGAYDILSKMKNSEEEGGHAH